MQVIVKCWTPEWYDAVTNAVLDLDEAMIAELLGRMAAVKAMKADEANQNELMGFRYNDHTPYWVDPTPDEVGLTDDEWDELSDGGFFILPVKLEKDWSKSETSMRPVTMLVSDDDVQWQGYDKHGGAESRCETYTLNEKDLKEILNEMHRRS